MKYLADENVPLIAVRRVRDAGLDITSASEISPGSPDVDLLVRATSEDRIVVTFDKDFAELVFRARQPAPAGVILMRDRPASPHAFAALLLDLLLSDRAWYGHFSVVTATRIRMVRLG